MLVTLDGIVIGRRDIGENNVFLDILTKDYGVIEATAHGIKKLTSRNAASACLFSYSRFCLNRNSLRYSLNSAEPIYNFFKLSSDLKLFRLAIYFSDLVKFTGASEQNSDELLEFFLISLYQLEKGKTSPELIKAIFELRVCGMLGFMPDLRACCECSCYQHEKMHFDFEESNIICDACASTDIIKKDFFELSPSLLHTLRFVSYSPIQKIFGFRLSGETPEQFYDFSEKYIKHQLGRTFTSLEYYKKLI